MNLIILSGGFGTRLHSISNGVPKALMPVGNSNCLDYILERVFNFDISHVFLSLHYKVEFFLDYILQSNYREKLTAVVEPKPLGTGGALKYVAEKTNISSPFFAINGDTLSDINLNKMYNKFEKQSCKAMVGISKVRDSNRYGTVKINNDEILSFNEKSVTTEEWINNGHYIFSREVFDKVNGVFSLEKEIFPKLTVNGELGAFKVENDNFIDMGIPEDYEKMCNIYVKKK